ncbi:MAG: TetR/AcrR family transcriptional regulator [Rhizobiales bacterium]|nr:TetR/AcrR family transcriptional regulator [Hyphomicrobiales bacterium]
MKPTLVPPAAPAEPGLRLRKKARQKAEILAAATELFRSNGFEETRMEDVGRLADVSLKTVYNYFPTKQSILIELVREDRIRMMALYEAILDEPHANLAEALSKLIRADIGDVLTPNDKKLWRELLAAEVRSSVDSAEEYQKNREIFGAYIRKMLLRFRRDGVLSSAVNITVAVDLIYAVLAYNFRIYCTSPEMMIGDVEKSVRAQLQLLITDWTVTRPAGTAPATRPGRKS